MLILSTHTWMASAFFTKESWRLYRSSMCPCQPACKNPAVVKAGFYQISKSSQQTLQDGGLRPPSPNSTSKPVMSWENMERTSPDSSSPGLHGFDSHLVCFPSEKAEVTGRRGGVTCSRPQAAQGLQGLWPVVGGDPPPSPWEPMPSRFLKAKLYHSADGETEAQSGGDLSLALSRKQGGARLTLKNNTAKQLALTPTAWAPPTNPRACGIFSLPPQKRQGCLLDPGPFQKMPLPLPEPEDPGRRREGRPGDSASRPSSVPFSPPQAHSKVLAGFLAFA